MGDWKSEVFNHIKNRQEEILEINGVVNSLVDDLKSRLGQDLELYKRGTAVEIPEDYSNPIWKVFIREYVISFTLKDVKIYRSKIDDYGSPVFDENITIETAIKDIITNSIKEL